MKTLTNPSPHSIFAFSSVTGNKGQERELDLTPPEGCTDRVREAESDLTGMSLFGTDESIDLAAEFLPKPDWFFFPAPKATAEAIFRLARKGQFDLVSVTQDLLARGELDGIGGPSAIAGLHCPTGRISELFPCPARARWCRAVIDGAYFDRQLTTAVVENVSRRLTAWKRKEEA